MRKPTVTASIVTGSSADNLANCLASLPAAAERVDLRVCIVDNCAAFDVERITGEFGGQLEIVRNERLKGFGANHNQVLQRLASDFGLVLNDDVILAAHAIDEMVDAALDMPDVGLVGPTLYSRTWDSAPVRAGGELNSTLPAPIRVCLYHICEQLGLARCVQGRRVRTPADDERVSELAFISGACCLCRREMLSDVGLYDEGFYMYFEDIDLGRRARAKGWRCVQANRAKVLHKEFSSFSPRSWTWIMDGARRFARKHHGLRVQLETALLVAVMGVIVRVRGRRRH